MSKPEKVFKMGAVRASIFRNVIERDGKSIPLAKVIIEVRYKDKNGEWKGTNSLSLNEKHTPNPCRTHKRHRIVEQIETPLFLEIRHSSAACLVTSSLSARKHLFPHHLAV